MMRYDYILEAPGDTPGWGGWVPDVPGAIAEGDTEQATVRMLEEVLEGVLEFRRDKGLPIPKPAPYTGRVPAGCRLDLANPEIASPSATDKQKAELVQLGMPPKRAGKITSGEASDAINRLRKKRGG